MNAARTAAVLRAWGWPAAARWLTAVGVSDATISVGAGPPLRPRSVVLEVKHAQLPSDHPLPPPAARRLKRLGRLTCRLDRGASQDELRWQDGGDSRLWDPGTRKAVGAPLLSTPYDPADWTDSPVAALLESTARVEPIAEVRLVADTAEFTFRTPVAWTSFLPLDVARPFIGISVHGPRLQGFSVIGFQFAADGLRALIR